MFLPLQETVSIDTNLTTVFLALIAAGSVTVTGILAYMTAKNAKLSEKNSEKITEVHQVVNSRMTELIETTKALAKAAGIVEGQTGVPQADTLPVPTLVTDVKANLDHPPKIEKTP